MSENGRVNLVVENIGGLYGRQSFDLYPGLNLVTAPNAAGKSSFVRGLQLLIADSKDLESHYLHSFGDNGRAELTMSDGKYIRCIRATGSGNISVRGEQMHPEGRKISTFCVASEDNELIERIRCCHPFGTMLLDFSDYQYYQLLAEYVQLRRDHDIGELRGYRVQQARLAELHIELEKSRVHLEKLKNERASLPELSIDRILCSEQDVLTHTRLREQHNLLVIEIRNLDGDCERLENSIKIKKDRRDRLLKELEQFEKMHPEYDDELDEMYIKLEQQKTEIEKHVVVMSRVQACLEDTDRAVKRYIQFGFSKCLACGQPIKIEFVQDRQADLVKRKKALSEQLLQLKHERNLQEKAIDEFRQQIKKNMVDRKADANSLSRNIAISENSLETKLLLLGEKKPELEKLIQSLRDLESELNQDVQNSLEYHRKLDQEIGRADQRTKTIESQIDDIGKNIGPMLSILENRVDFLTKFHHYIVSRSGEIKSAVRDMFNRNISMVYELLEFSDKFDRIYLNNDLELRIVRRLGERRQTTTSKTLSGGERETIALVLMLAGRQAYVPEFPFFVADETTFYDQTRLQRVVNYIKEHVPYTVITRLVPKEKQSGISIDHSF